MGPYRRYGVIRFVVQFFRGDDTDRLLLGMAHSQYTAVAMIVVAVILARRAGDARSSDRRRRAST